VYTESGELDLDIYVIANILDVWFHSVHWKRWTLPRHICYCQPFRRLVSYGTLKAVNSA